MASTATDDYRNTINLLDLNDDCLLEIFKYLSVDEVFTLLGSICERIDAIIYVRLSLVKHLSINLRHPPILTTPQLEILGRNLTSLYISSGYSLPSNLTLNYLQAICSQQTLQFLTLHYVQFDEHFQECLIRVAAQLQFLDLSYCQLTDELLMPVLEKCENLRTLTIFGNYNLRCVALSCLRAKYLKDLKVDDNSNCRHQIQKFIEQNPHVTVTIFAIGFLGHVRNHYLTS